jgi:hypothetical protein
MRADFNQQYAVNNKQYKRNCAFRFISVIIGIVSVGLILLWFAYIARVFQLIPLSLYTFEVEAIEPANDPKPFHQHEFSLPSYHIDSPSEYKDIISGLHYKEENFEESKDIPHSQHFFTLGDLLTDWHPNDTSLYKWSQSRAHPNRGQHLRRFDFSNATQKELAATYREHEVPFILYNLPALDLAMKTAFSKTSLTKVFGDIPRHVEKSADNNFMYYKGKLSEKAKKQFPDWIPPQEDTTMTFKNFLKEAREADEENRAAGAKPLHYMTLSAGEGKRTTWIREGLPFFDPDDKYFVIDKTGYIGINCRFGMRGVIAAAHYDGKRNFIAMIRGRKRYVIQPPTACENLHLYPRGHPSARHSELTWSDLSQLRSNPDLYNSQATEVILAMGEMLYLPSYWFHYIISQDASVQCNCRSGQSIEGRDAITQCGFY